jgi:hypothetical protein
MKIRSTPVLVCLFVFLLFVGLPACDDDDDDQPGDDDVSPADDDDDDDDNDDDDNDDDSAPTPEPNGSWPDDPGPLVAWFATQPDFSTKDWVGLYKVIEGAVESVPPIGDMVFTYGAAGSADVAWATNHVNLFWLVDGVWEFASSAPECPMYEGSSFRNVAAFFDGRGYVSCRGANQIAVRDEGTWRLLTNTVFPEDGACWIDCLRFGRCVVQGGHEIALLDGGQFESTVTPGPHVHRAVYQNDETAYAILINSTYPEFWSLFTLNNLTWEADPRFEPNEFNSPALVRINDEYTAFSHLNGPGGDGTVILDGRDNLIETDWPYFRWMAFAPGGSGIGIDDSAHRAYLIEGFELTEIFTWDDHTERPSGFLTAADAAAEN